MQSSTDKRPTKLGSTESTRQVYKSVRDGKQVRVSIPMADPIDGWVCGADDYHWIVVDADDRTHLIHKSVPAISIAAEATITEAPEDVQKRVEGFRKFVMRNHFNHVEPSKES